MSGRGKTQTMTRAEKASLVLSMDAVAQAAALQGLVDGLIAEATNMTLPENLTPAEAVARAACKRMGPAALARLGADMPAEMIRAAKIS